MNIHVYLLCFNEEKIIRQVLEYYLSFCSRVFVFDNYSTDKSVEMASSYERVKVIQFDTGGKLNDSKHVHIKTEEYKRYSRKGGEYTEEVADWIICADMDELVYCPNIVDVLTEYKKQGVTVPYITAFNIVGENELSDAEPIIHQYQKGFRFPHFDKRAIFDANFDMSYSLGCHPYGVGFEYMKDRYGYKSSGEFPIALLHYKHIGTRYYEAALKNVERFDNIKKDETGSYVGAGSHYARFVEHGPNGSPFIGIATQIMDDKYNLQFDKFERSTGDVGWRPEATEDSKEVFETDVDVFRDAALKLENSYFDLAFKLMKIAKRFRKNGPFINAKLKEYKERKELLS